MLPQLMQVHMLRRAPTINPAPRWRSLPEAFAAQLAALRASRAAAVQNTPSVASAALNPTRQSMRQQMSAGTADSTTTLADWLGTPQQRALASAITRASQHAGVAPNLSLAVAVAESSLDPSARSADGLSKGTFQVTGPTAAEVRGRFARRELRRPPGSEDVALGVAHLRYLHDLFSHETTLGRSVRTVAVDDPRERSRFAVAAYNAGEGRVARAQEQAAALRRDPSRFESIRALLPRLTQRYVDRVMRYAGRTAASTVSA
jgi:soluble lytic murein transglycosylase-like protein